MHSFDSLRDFLRVRHGTLRKSKVNLYAIVRDESFLIESFVNHYRRIGVEQFLFFDDGSEDGTLEFLCGQPDCVVVTSDFRYGDPVEVIFPDGKRRGGQWKRVLRSLLPKVFFDGQYAIHVDLDEFLILPQAVDTLSQLIDTLASIQADCVAAGMVEFYPMNFSDLQGDAHARTFEDLVRLYPYFDARPLVSVPEGEHAQSIGVTTTARLFHSHGVEVQEGGKKIATTKIPIVRWREGMLLLTSHLANSPPTSKILLTLAHFKFTHDFSRKLDSALRWQSYRNSSAKYKAYSKLLEAMRHDDSLCCDFSAQYAGPAQLERLGLLKWAL